MGSAGYVTGHMDGVYDAGEKTAWRGAAKFYRITGEGSARR